MMLRKSPIRNRSLPRPNLVLFVSVILSVAFGNGSGVSPDAPAAIAGAPKVQKIEDRGDIKIIYEKPRDPSYVELQNTLEESKLFDEVARALNKKLILPRNLLIRFSECGVVNAFYDPKSKSITMCYELISAVAEDFSQLSMSEDELDEATVHATLFVFFHEIGHALIDILNLPATGREEDAVDQLATLMLIESGAGGEDATLDGAVWFLLRAEKTNIDDLAYWDEHSFDAQRFYNIACWVYGQNAKGNAYLVTEGHLPKERAVRCADEYRKMSDSWAKLLSPYLKK